MFSLQDYRDEALQGDASYINTIFCSIICCLIFCCSDFASREGESYQRGERKWPLPRSKCVCLCVVRVVVVVRVFAAAVVVVFRNLGQNWLRQATT